ncbi:uncharacterized protein K02A2.6-like [Rhagoletis pomonella]|uniref:uncharacterized protein K02A2.6-like n=1 Tax=Rhagoletis pomonella TaxID=28610 RepID=UPI0017823D3D|nr:uncharacterized protein K02A2.6-like [Rhagoletis pomonella]
MADKCQYKEVTCHFCKKKGHLQKMCLQRKKKSLNMISADVKAKQECTVEDLFQLDLPKAKGSRDKVFCKLNANNKNIELEIDTGSPVKLINVDDAKKYFPKERVKTTDTELYSYCKTKLDCLGYIWVSVNDSKAENAKIYSAIRSQAFVGPKLNEILQKFPQLFSEGTGKIVGHQAKLYLKNNVPPKFVKASRVPFPLLKAVEDEIAGQVQEGILVKVDTSEWATPIVAVPKRGGAVRICGDYKVTLKPALVVDEHLLPTIDELFSAMADGEKFSKIDMSNAYLQPEVHPDDQHLLTLSTHKGLYKPTRLMFGVPCAPNDIKITAINDETHLQRIEDVLRRLNEHNMRINLKKSDFLRDRMEYCGYEIDKTGIRKLRNKVLAIQNMKPPTTKDELRAVLVTDNKAIAQIFSPQKGLPTLSATRMQHYAIYLEAFNYDVRVKKSQENANADVLLRLPSSDTYPAIEEVDVVEMEFIQNLPVKIDCLSEASSKDTEVANLLGCLKYGRFCEPKDRFSIPKAEFTLQKGCLLHGIRVYIPKKLRDRVLEEEHFGMAKMKMLARAYC